MRRSKKNRRRRRDRRAWILFTLLLGVSFCAWWYVSDAFAPDIAARVLFAETANCTDHERQLVAGVMQNRVGNAAFGGARSIAGVVRQPGAFSCIGDGRNANWQKSRHPALLIGSERSIWQECVACIAGPIAPAIGPSGRALVYYHDKSIQTPAAWNNSAWRTVRELTTEHLVFYSVVRAPR